MFANPPKIFCHNSSIRHSNLVTLDYIINKTNESVSLFHRFCPHRRYPLETPGNLVKEISCKFHGYKWNEFGQPVNNSKQLYCGTPSIGKSGLVFKNFIEPNHSWVNDLSKETNLSYSHSFFGKSDGSWLWYMDVNADLLHVHKHGIHPFLSKQIDLNDIKLENGDDWILQTHNDGWWCCIFPFTFVEYGRPGKLSINSVVPNDIKNEFGFQWMTQIYYDKDIVTANDKLIFETLEQVFIEDIQAAELQRGPYFPLTKADSKHEEHCIIWGNWVRKNKII